MIRFPGALLACALVALLPASASAWTIAQGGGQALVRHETPEYIIELRCSSARRDVVDFTLARTGGRSFGPVRGVMLWVQHADGRMDRNPIDVTNHGQYITGDWLIGGHTLDFFRQARAVEVDLSGQGQVVSTHANGTGAARLAILEQCGF